MLVATRKQIKGIVPWFKLCKLFIENIISNISSTKTLCVRIKAGLNSTFLHLIAIWTLALLTLALITRTSLEEYFNLR